jgi:hypothetical protein
LDLNSDGNSTRCVTSQQNDHVTLAFSNLFLDNNTLSLQRCKQDTGGCRRQDRGIFPVDDNLYCWYPHSVNQRLEVSTGDPCLQPSNSNLCWTHDVCKYDHISDTVLVKDAWRVICHIYILRSRASCCTYTY